MSKSKTPGKATSTSSKGSCDDRANDKGKAKTAIGSNLSQKEKKGKK